MKDRKLIPPGSYVAVVGGVNIDICGRPDRELIGEDSNPGTISTSIGGVGRNIAHNLTLLGIPVRFITAFGDDADAQRIEAGCARIGIDIRDSLYVPGGTTPKYLFISDERGDMKLAVSDMKICDRINSEYLAEKQSVLDGASLIVADANLTEDALFYLSKHAKVPVFVDPVSVAKTGRLENCLRGIHTMKPNVKEAEALSGVHIPEGPSAARSLREAAEVLIGKGLKRVFITQGASGTFAAERGRSAYYRCCPAALKNVTGAGDAFMAGLVYSYMMDMNLGETAGFAAATAAMAVEALETVNGEITAERVWERV